MRRLLLTTGLALALLAPMATAAHAVVINKTYTFSASGFTNFGPDDGILPPLDVVMGSFTLSFDTAPGDQTDQTVGLVFHNLSMPVVDDTPGDLTDPVIGWNYRPVFDSLLVGGLHQGSGAISKGSFPNDDFVLSIDGMTTTPVFKSFWYASKTENAFFKAGELSMTIADPPGRGGAVPEPGAWALMLTGFGAAGALLRRRRALGAVA